MRNARLRWLVVPLAAFFLLFSGSIAVAPDCHIESAAPTKNSSTSDHNHSAVPHSHADQPTGSTVSSAQDALAASGSALNSEICFIIGIVVLLLLRYFHLTRPISSLERVLWPKFHRPFTSSKNPSYLNLTHLQLGIIRI